MEGLVPVQELKYEDVVGELLKGWLQGEALETAGLRVKNMLPHHPRAQV